MMTSRRGRQRVPRRGDRVDLVALILIERKRAVRDRSDAVAVGRDELRVVILKMKTLAGADCERHLRIHDRVTLCIARAHAKWVGRRPTRWNGAAVSGDDLERRLSGHRGIVRCLRRAAILGLCRARIWFRRRAVVRAARAGVVIVLKIAAGATRTQTRERENRCELHASNPTRRASKPG